ncbi:TRAP transporter small permease subunit [Pseudoponticoccus marisrubri]|uniref:TRAP transporter small permease protein n=1 Tax=Pseudoponticoccus marisrubri TaxID=1685382 RepID=A0A0W7WNB9_9RHOB|nr:TRAP transporter small permease [Pseudoponticoccus marisrubri]KUF12101.1 C4-dicarboxylate ABC transporter substrate-binding protein [Pseudoponticoccus marisrubri]
METQSVWLGPARQPVRLLMVLFTAASLLLVGALFIAAMFFDSAIGMHQMLRPEGRALVYLTHVAVFGAIFLAALYLSDTQGSIEPKPEGFFDIVSLVCSRISMISIVLLVFVMFYEVVARYVFEKPTLWANELSLWIAGFLFLLAGLYAMQQRSHIRIYIIYDLMPRWMRKLSDCISVALIWAFTLALMWGGYNEARDKFLRWEAFGTAWDPPIPATIKPAILIIILMVAIQALSNLIADWNKAPESHSPADDIDEEEIAMLRRNLQKDDD